MSYRNSGQSPGERSAAIPWRGVLLAWVAISLLMLVGSGGRLSPANFVDGDDALRLQQVRDLLGGQAWFDLRQYRIAPPDGVAMHWTRVVDIPIAAVILLLRPLLGQGLAESIAIVIVPLLNLLAAMALAARLASRQFGPRIGIVAALLVAAAVPASFRMMPLRIDHHAMQFVLALVALNGLFACASRIGAAMAGAALALALAISLESLPLAVIVGGLCTLRLWRGQGEWLIGYLLSLSVASLALFLATRGLADLAQHCDAVSPVHVAALLWMGGGAAIVLPQLRDRPPLVSLLAVGLIGAGAVGIAAAWAPQCLAGDAFASVDPLVRQVWLDSVLEGLPVWRQEPGFAATIILLPLFGLLACLRLFKRAADRAAKLFWLDYALLLLGATLVGLLVARASGVSCLFATVPAAWQVAEQFARWRRDSLLVRRMGRVVVMITLLLPGVLVDQAARLLAPAGQAHGEVALGCDFSRAVPALEAFPPQTLLTGLDIGPTLLVMTRHKVIATAHHRADTAIRDVIEAFLGPDEAARLIMTRRGPTMVVICPGGSEARFYAEKAPGGFIAHLMSGKTPPWLEPVPMPDAGGVKAWRIKQP
ncbi:hypothetical protein ACQKO5_03860 [Novosphingobium subterraneum]|uniref:hypothetical protein n=1 Tax=Novosphingobium subterraneum TaxID=48936 RepID=UPI003CFBFAF9